ncbi:MAG: YibE/F family protein [Oscillospiraceae bacterium]|nr:YibE/F family protein [Oscillospiraceae bacterium]
MVIRSRRFLVGIIGLLLCVIFIINSGAVDFDREPYFIVQRARVLTVDNSRLSPDPYVQNLYIGRQTIEIEVLSGDHSGQRFRIENTMSRFFNHQAVPGMELLVSINTNQETGQVVHVDVFGHSRANFLYVFVGFFLLILLLIGRRKGLYSAISLLFTLIMVVFFLIPFIIRGHNPILFAIFTAALTTVFSIFMVSDISLKSLAAIGGTLAGVTSAGIVGVIAGRVSHISGMHLEHAEELIFRSQDAVIQIPQLLFAGIVIAALGAVMDVGMSISSSVFEIKRANPKMDTKRLYKSGMTIGGDIMGTMSNTLILAFAGASITVMVIIALYELPYLRFINLDLLALEIVQGLSASIGLILAVPVTAFLAALLASNNKVSAFLKDRVKVAEQDVSEN